VRAHRTDRGDFREESIAYALATGIAPMSTRDLDADIERAGRRARWERRKAKRGDAY
jgi:hypothetical protein